MNIYIHLGHGATCFKWSTEKERFGFEIITPIVSCGEKLPTIDKRQVLAEYDVELSLSDAVALRAQLINTDEVESFDMSYSCSTTTYIFHNKESKDLMCLALKGYIEGLEKIKAEKSEELLREFDKISDIYRR